jgi:hypothetical protein
MSKSILEMFEFQARRDHRDPLYDKMKSDYPLLGAALVGSYDAEKKCGHRGATLMVFVDGDNLKATLSHRITRTTIFMTLPDMVLSLEDVEKQLQDGRYDAKKGN